MTLDHFAILHQPRRPWLNAAKLKEEFHRASSVLHPDVPATGDASQFAALNTAYAVLSEPASRLRHLLALEASDQLARPRPIPEKLADFFMQLAELRRALDAFFQKQNVAASAITRALFAPEKIALASRCETAQSTLESAHENLLAELRALDTKWDAQREEDVEQLARLYQQFAYLSKWRGQLREAIFQLGITS